MLKLDRFDDLKGWEVQGKPAVAAGAVSLSAAGDSVEQTTEALDEGTAGVDFRAEDGPAGALWQAEAEFKTPGGPRVVTVTLAGADPAVKANRLEGTTSRWAPAAGWHRLVVRFSPSSLRVEVDDTPLWYNLERGPGGPLVRWRLACRPAGGTPRGRVNFAEFALHRADNLPRRPPGESDRDELWLADGDQVFGRVVRGDRAGLTIEGRFGRRTLPWTAVRAFHPRREAASEKVSATTTVQIDNGADSTWDELAGVVTAWDDKHCGLRHALLGELTLPRERVRSLRWPDRE